MTGNNAGCCAGWIRKPAAIKQRTMTMETKVDAHIVRDPNGICRIMVKRAKYKHWFELGRHAATDAAFEQALAAGSVCWNPGIVDRSKLF